MLREQVGYTREDLAAVLGVPTRRIRQWESANPSDNEVPEGVWLWLEDARARQVERINAALEVVHAYGTDPEYIELPCYQGQEHYEAVRRDQPQSEEQALEDRFTVANATNRELAALLMDEEFEVRFVYPTGPRQTSHGF